MVTTDNCARSVGRSSTGIAPAAWWKYDNTCSSVSAVTYVSRLTHCALARRVRQTPAALSQVLQASLQKEGVWLTRPASLARWYQSRRVRSLPAHVLHCVQGFVHRLRQRARIPERCRAVFYRLLPFGLVVEERRVDLEQRC